MPYIFTLTTGADQSISSIASITGHFFCNYGQPQRNNINSLQKKNIYQKFGGAMAPLAPPLATPLAPLNVKTTLNVKTAKCEKPNNR